MYVDGNWQDWLRVATPWLVRVACALGVFIIFWSASGLPAQIFQRLEGPVDLERPSSGRWEVLFILGQIFRILLVLVGMLGALVVLGVDVAGLVAGLGLTGLAVGVAFKDVLANLISGGLIMFYRPFQRGDHIKVADFEGRVRDINFRYTVLEMEGKRVLIPNSTLFTTSITIDEQ